MKRSTLLLVLLVASAASVRAQSGTVTGLVTDAQTKQPLIGANVLLVGTTQGAATDLDGNYVITGVPAGTYSVRFSYLGFDTRTETDVVVRPDRVTRVEVGLSMSAIETAAVVVNAGYFPRSDAQPVSLARFTREEVRRAPGSAGDVSRILFALPSVAKLNDTMNSLVVRGGTSFENAFYLDNIEIPNINHFPEQGATGGPIGMVNVEFIDDVTFNAGGFSALYGNRLSSVTDLSLREGNREEVDLQIDLNMAGVGGLAEGPMGRKGSWMLSARRSFLDLIVGAIGEMDAIPQYGDVQGKVTLDLSPDHRLSAVGLLGLDAIGMDRDKAIENGTNVYANADISQGTIGVNWRWLWSESGFSNTSVSVSNVDYDRVARDTREYMETGEELVLLDLVGFERSWKLRNVNHLRLGGEARIEFGVDARIDQVDFDHRYGRYDDVLGQELEPLRATDRSSNGRVAGFASLTLRPVGSVAVTPGVRVAYADLTGRTEVDPRLSARVDLSARTAVTGAVGLYHQELPLFLLAQAPGNRDLATPRAVHVVVGLSHLLAPETRLTIEAYDKQYRDMPADPTQPQLYLLDEVARYGTLIHHPPLVDGARARARGIEVLVQKRLAQRLYGHASVGMSRAEYREIDGVWRARSVENRFMAHVEGGYKPNRNWEFSARWIVASGAPFTPFDEDASVAARRAVLDASRINDAHMPTYQSLNIRFDRRHYFGWGNMVTYLSIWNAYAHENVAAYVWNEVENAPEGMSGWGMLPVFGVEIEF
jgi:hypothetical protein